MSATPYDLSFFAPGVPAPKGSLDAKPIPGSRKVYMVAGNQTNQDRWASAVRDAARTYPDTPEGLPWSGNVEVIVQFVIPERRGVHAATDRGAGDLDKLQRCVWDALTGIVYVDDSQVTVSGASKRMATPGEMGGATIHVRLLGEG
jgi:crossover junction endodeoxyribonuclease RusA